MNGPWLAGYLAGPARTATTMSLSRHSAGVCACDSARGSRPPYLCKGTEKARICKTARCACAIDCTSEAEECGEVLSKATLKNSKILKDHAWDLKRPCAAFRLGA